MIIKNRKKQKNIAEFLYEHQNISSKIQVSEIKSYVEKDSLVDQQTIDKIISKSNLKTLRMFFKTYFYYKITENLNFSLPFRYDSEELYYKSQIHANSDDIYSEIKEFYTYINYLNNNHAKMELPLEEDEIKMLYKISERMTSFYRNFKYVENYILGESSYFQNLPYDYNDCNIKNNSRVIIQNPYLIKINISYKNIHQIIDFQKLRSIILFSFGDSKNCRYEIKNMIVALGIAKKLSIGNIRNAQFIVISYPLENKYFYCEITNEINFTEIINNVDKELSK